MNNIAPTTEAGKARKAHAKAVVEYRLKEPSSADAARGTAIGETAARALKMKAGAFEVGTLRPAQGASK